MSGVAVVWYLLKTNAPILAHPVPAARIKSGVLPLNTALPNISVMLISGVPRNTVAMTETPKVHTDRVQVSVLADDYPETKALMALILAALPNTSGTINGVAVDSILPDVEGPDLTDETAKIFQASRDFRVTYRL